MGRIKTTKGQENNTAAKQKTRSKQVPTSTTTRRPQQPKQSVRPTAIKHSHSKRRTTNATAQRTADVTQFSPSALRVEKDSDNLSSVTSNMDIPNNASQNSLYEQLKQFLPIIVTEVTKNLQKLPSDVTIPETLEPPTHTQSQGISAIQEQRSPPYTVADLTQQQQNQSFQLTSPVSMPLPPSDDGLSQLNSSIHSLLGKAPDSLNNNSGTMGGVSFDQGFIPVHVPLGQYLSDKIKNKITSDQFVPLSQLLPNNNEETITLNLNQSQDGPLFQIASKQAESKKITNIHTWSRAFETFVAVYSEAHPTSTPALMKYASVIRDLDLHHGFNASSFYDETFRKFKQSNPNWPWNALHPEIWIRSTSMNKVEKSRIQTYQQRSNPYNNSKRVQSQNQKEMPQNHYNSHRNYKQPFRQNLCYAYAYKGMCSFRNCRYRHECPICHGPHPKSVCEPNNNQYHSNQNNQQPNVGRYKHRNQSDQTNIKTTNQGQELKNANPNQGART